MSKVAYCRDCNAMSTVHGGPKMYRIFRAAYHDCCGRVVKTKLEDMDDDIPFTY